LIFAIAASRKYSLDTEHYLDSFCSIRFAEKRKALIAADPSKAEKIQADEDEYTTAFEAVLGEVLQLVSPLFPNFVSHSRLLFVIFR
jgi:hypothetical protein